MIQSKTIKRIEIARQYNVSRPTASKWMDNADRHNIEYIQGKHVPEALDTPHNHAIFKQLEQRGRIYCNKEKNSLRRRSKFKLGQFVRIQDADVVMIVHSIETCKIDQNGIECKPYFLYNFAFSENELIKLTVKEYYKYHKQYD